MTSTIIDGVLYDTEDAEKIASFQNTGDTSDFRYVKEVLYKTESGTYFLYGEGGPRTEYARSTPDGRTGSSEIRVLDEEQALSWCEKRDVDTEITLNEFSHLIEKA